MSLAELKMLNGFKMHGLCRVECVNERDMIRLGLIEDVPMNWV